LNEFIHSVTLDKSLCTGCTNCIKRCPTQAIRVHDGVAHILKERCIDCGECIRVCPHHAKKPIYDSIDRLSEFAYNIALPAPTLYAQFNLLEDADPVLSALHGLGFDDIFEVAAAAELVSDATRRVLAGSSPRDLPLISSACPAVVRLIRVRFPNLIDHVLPVLAPMEQAARLARERAVERTGLSPDQIGVFFLSPCPAKVTAVRDPIGSDRSEVNGVLAIKDIYPALCNLLKNAPEEALSHSGRIGMSWASSGGECSGLISVDNYLAADGIENVIRVLEDLEDEKLHDLAFVELNACAGGCVGGVLTVENPYIARAKLKKLRRYLPVSENRLESSIPPQMLWSTDLEYAPVMELGATRAERFERYARLEEIRAQLPDLDCGACGAPTCDALAEDIVRGYNSLDSCAVLLRRRLQNMVEQLQYQASAKKQCECPSGKSAADCATCPANSEKRDQKE